MQTVQANLRRSPQDVESLAAARVPIRLVKGAYVEDRGESRSPWGAETDCRLRRAWQAPGRARRRPLARDTRPGDPRAAAAAQNAIPGPAVECLLGVRPDDARRLAAEGRHVRIYVPYGERWFRYAARRAAESIGV